MVSGTCTLNKIKSRVTRLNILPRFIYACKAAHSKIYTACAYTHFTHCYMTVVVVRIHIFIRDKRTASVCTSERGKNFRRGEPRAHDTSSITEGWLYLCCYLAYLSLALLDSNIKERKVPVVLLTTAQHNINRLTKHYGQISASRIFSFFFYMHGMGSRLVSGGYLLA